MEQTINKTLCILLFFALASCAKHLPVKDAPQINSIETEQEPDWLLIGGQKVYNFDRPRQYNYYLKSEAENAIGILLKINPKNENSATSLEGIEQLVNLQSLSLKGLNLDELDYSPLQTLQNLEEITFECGDVSKMTRIPDLSFIASRERIKEIVFTRCALTNFDNIEYFPNLRLVEAWNDADFNNLKALNNLRYLETLRISAINSVFRIEETASLLNLKELLLRGKEINVKGIESLTALENINFFKSEIKNKNFLAESRNLQWLEIAIHDQNPDILFINNMRNLKGLTIYADDGVWNFPRNKNPYQVLDVSPIGSLSQLHYLELRGFILQNIKALDRLDNLDEAHINASVLKDESEKTEKTLHFYPTADGH